MPTSQVRDLKNNQTKAKLEKIQKLAWQQFQWASGKSSDDPTRMTDTALALQAGETFSTATLALQAYEKK